jgi:hypothetical protein
VLNCGCHSSDYESCYLLGWTLGNLEKSNISDEQTSSNISVEEQINLQISKKQPASKGIAILLVPCLAYLLFDPKDGGNSQKCQDLSTLYGVTTQNTTLLYSVCIGTVVPNA